MPTPLYPYSEQDNPNLNPQFRRAWNGFRPYFRLKNEEFEENSKQKSRRRRRERRAAERAAKV